MDDLLLFVFFFVSVLVLGSMMPAMAIGGINTLLLEKEVKSIKIGNKTISGILYNESPITNKGYLLKQDLFVGLKISYADTKGKKMSDECGNILTQRG